MVPIMRPLRLPLAHSASLVGAGPAADERARGTPARWLAAPSVAVLLVSIAIPRAKTIWFKITR
ncbi:sugar ABC transporter permease, partial [Burkholderia pseudomallei]